MLISCKCLNFLANGSGGFGKLNQFDKNNQLSNNNRSHPIAGYGAGAGDGSVCKNATMRMLMGVFVQKYQRGFPFYTHCMELMHQAIGPLENLSVTIQQRDLICTIPCDSWDIKICINCNTPLCFKDTAGTVYFVNSNLLTTNEEVAHRMADRSFSNTFGIRIMDHQLQRLDDSPFHSDKNNKANSRVRLLTQSLQMKLQKDIAEMDERILRYTEQQFALLKSNREKSEQEYQILVSLVNQVPEQVINAMGAAINSASAPTTPTALTKITSGEGICAVAGVATSNSSASAMDSSSSNTQVSSSSSVSAQSVFSFNNNANSNNNNKKASSYDTPPATPDSTPMSVGNSPTFNRQQQQQQQQPQTSIGIHVAGSGNRSLIGTGVFYLNSSNSNGIGVDAVDLDGDCLFELEGVDSGYTMAPRSSLPLNMSDMEEIAEGAEEALDELEETAIPIPNIHSKRRSISNFGRSLPIAIANSVTDTTLVADSDDDLLDDNVDIAASIKALARSVHGDAVFGDLPRPRLGTQI